MTDDLGPTKVVVVEGLPDDDEAEPIEVEMVLVDWPQALFKHLRAATFPMNTVWPHNEEEMVRRINTEQLGMLAREWVQREENNLSEAYATAEEAPAHVAPHGAGEEILSRLLDTVTALQADVAQSSTPYCSAPHNTLGKSKGFGWPGSEDEARRPQSALGRSSPSGWHARPPRRRGCRGGRSRWGHNRPAASHRFGNSAWPTGQEEETSWSRVASSGSLRLRPGGGSGWPAEAVGGKGNAALGTAQAGHEGEPGSLHRGHRNQCCSAPWRDPGGHPDGGALHSRAPPGWGERTLGYLTWGIARAATLAKAGESKKCHLLLLLLIAAVEQYKLDSSWTAAWRIAQLAPSAIFGLASSGVLDCSALPGQRPLQAHPGHVGRMKRRQPSDQPGPSHRPPRGRGRGSGNQEAGDK